MNYVIAFSAQLARGIGQIVLQENTLSGLLILTGVFYGSFLMGLALLVGVIFSTATAILLGYEKTSIDKGLYGFNGALVGVGTLFFLHSTFATWLMVIVGSSLTTLVQHFFLKHKVSLFTLPFVLVAWLILTIAKLYFSGLLLISPEPNAISYYMAPIHGFGQVIFQEDSLSGILFLIAILVHSPLSALYASAGAVLATLLAIFLSAPIADVGAGLYSYNAILCAIALAGMQLKDAAWVFISIVLSVAIGLVMLKYKLIMLTFPFVLATVITLLLKQRRFSKNHSVT